MRSRPLHSNLAIALQLPGSVLAAPVGTNTGFESGLTRTTNANLAVQSGSAFEGSKCLNLQTGYIQQTFSVLVVGQVHKVRLAYIWTGSDFQLGGARVLIDGSPVGEIHNGQKNEYLSSNGFEFTTAVQRVESLETTGLGLRIDAVHIEEGGLPLPPEHVWASLQVAGDARGGRKFVNGGFESAIGNPTTDPDNSGPVGNEHLTGDSLPGCQAARLPGCQAARLPGCQAARLAGDT
jgi:hypothetical protein